MKRRGYTLAQVADAVGKSTSTVGAWAQGKNFPEVEVQMELASFLKESVAWLIHGEVTPSPEIPSKVEEAPQDPYGQKPVKITVASNSITGDRDLASEARYLLERALLAAKNDPALLGWIVGQLRIHLASVIHNEVPPKEHPLASEARRRAQESTFKTQDAAIAATEQAMPQGRGKASAGR